MASTQSVEFEAGKMTFDPATKKVKADPRRGKVKVYINQDGEKKFEWRDLQTNTVENEHYVFETDAKFDKVVKSSGRVYYLHFESYDEKHFFWLQEKDASKDDELCQKVNNVINFSLDAMEEEPPRAQVTQPTQPTQTQPAVSRNPTTNIPSNVPSQQSNRQQDFANMFAQAMRNIQQGGAGGAQRKPTPSLNDILTPQFLETILQDKEYQDNLIQHLPEKQQTPEGLRASIKSAQLQQAIDALDEALNSEEGMTVLMSLGFNHQTFMRAQDGTDAFLLALEEWAKQNGGGSK